jgi:Tfp pilus assembly protein PilV
VPQLAGPNHSSRKLSARRGKRGVALVVVLIGLAVTTMIFLSILKLMAIERQSVELQVRQMQATWLAESAVERARARLSAQAAYRGETWNLSAQDIGGRDGARIAIRVDDVAGRPDRRLVHIEADYPEDPNGRARQVREVIVKL